MFIRGREANGVVYYQVIETYRDADNRVRQKSLVSLGRCEDPREALANMQRKLVAIQEQRRLVLATIERHRYQARQGAAKLGAIERKLACQAERIRATQRVIRQLDLKKKQLAKNPIW
jgi:hypothetical protein